VTLPSDPTTPGLSELIERVERAEGPDREIDIAIMRLTDPRSAYLYLPLIPPHTSSLDAIVGLIERELPGAFWSVCRMEDGPFAQVIRVMPDGGYIGALTQGGGKTAALALCLSFLRALSARGGK